MSAEPVPERMAYIGRATCGCIRVAIVDEPDYAKDTAKDVARAIRDGLTVEHVPTQYVRDNMLRCPHGLDPERGPLPGAEKRQPVFGQPAR